MPPSDWLIAVAEAAPARPKGSTAVKSASSTMLAIPAITVTISPSWGRSAVMKKLWNSYCSIKAGSAGSIMRAYSTQFSSISPLAPSQTAMGRIKIKPKAPRTTPKATVTYTKRENNRRARSLSPSPMVRAIRALPPAPNINPTVPSIISTGMIKFTAAKGGLPTKLDTKKPSTTP